MQKFSSTFISIIIAFVIGFCVYNCEDFIEKDKSDIAGTYKVHKKDNYVTPSYNLVLNQDGSVRVNIDGEGETYGSWDYYDHSEYKNMCYIQMDNNFYFVFGYKNPVLDLTSNCLYVSLEAFECKNPNKRYKVSKIK